MSRELLILAILEESYGIKVCFAHPKPVHYDGRQCPCCQMEKELRESQKES